MSLRGGQKPTRQSSINIRSRLFNFLLEEYHPQYYILKLTTPHPQKLMIIISVGCAFIAPNYCEKIIMPDYKRWFLAGGTYFFTVLTYNRRKIFNNANARKIFHRAIDEVQNSHPFEISGIVLLPDHCHCIWKMSADENFSIRWAMIKRRFTKLWLSAGGWDKPVSASRTKRGERGIWQRRFWEHLIRNQHDFARHMDYIHYNPVKHGYVKCPHQWKHSSFHHWAKEGIYKSDWLCQCRNNCKPPDFMDISRTVGE